MTSPTEEQKSRCAYYQSKKTQPGLPLDFLKDRYNGPHHTIDPKLGQKCEEVVRKTGNVARKARNPVAFGTQINFIEKRVHI